MEPNYSCKASRKGGRGLDRYLAGERANHTEFHYKQYNATGLHSSRYSSLETETVILKPTIYQGNSGMSFVFTTDPSSSFRGFPPNSTLSSSIGSSGYSQDKGCFGKFSFLLYRRKNHVAAMHPSAPRETPKPIPILVAFDNGLDELCDCVFALDVLVAYEVLLLLLMLTLVRVFEVVLVARPPTTVGEGRVKVPLSQQSRCDKSKLMLSLSLWQQ